MRSQSTNNSTRFTTNPLAVVRHSSPSAQPLVATNAKKTLKRNNRHGALGWQYGRRNLVPKLHWNQTMNNRANKNNRGKVAESSFGKGWLSSQQNQNLRASRESMTKLTPGPYTSGTYVPFAEKAVKIRAERGTSAVHKFIESLSISEVEKRRLWRYYLYRIAGKLSPSMTNTNSVLFAKVVGQQLDLAETEATIMNLKNDAGMNVPDEVKSKLLEKYIADGYAEGENELQLHNRIAEHEATYYPNHLFMNEPPRPSAFLNGE